MKSSLKIVLCLVVFVIAIISIVFLKPESMATRFKLEYEALNGQKAENGSTYMDVNISNDNKIVYADYDQIFDVLDGTGVIYFGFPECPWCRNAAPVLLEAAEETAIEQIYYLNNISRLQYLLKYLLVLMLILFYLEMYSLRLYLFL